ncbi:RNA-binding protein Nova-1 [Hypsibius exemplaris]|uniref:RNA-binding protein Nova-1 n=1 Tax=Hypsibius exemplaris TaxID=2072580 RepID=A0A1W0WCU1_HYPEX|nr:RNA-binding protein Nova-1 [Hypsibius exemplaris]
MNHSNSTPTASDGDFASSEVSSSGGTPTHQQSISSRSPHPDGSEHGGKRNGNYAYPTDGAMFFKILVPSVAAGAIIGKGGETIAMLQQDTQTRIKMSKATDFFPGTNERVCVVYGPTPESILQVYDFVAQKIREKPDSVAKGPSEFDTKQSTEREKQVKILVPNSTAGMIIGKAGNYIKYIKEESGAYVQISQKAKDHAITERCITVIGDEGQARKACGLILTKIFEDPLSNTCPNLSYADVVGPVPNYNPTGSPFANIVHGAGGHHPHHPNDHYMSNPNHFFASLRSTLRMSGYTEDSTTEIIAAMTTLSNYGILGLGLGLGGLAMNMGYLPQHGGGHGINGNGNATNVGGSPGGYTDASSSSPLSSTKTSPLRYNGQQDSLDSSYNTDSLLHHQLGSDNLRGHSGQDYRRVPDHQQQHQYLTELEQRGRGRVVRPQHAKFA